MHNTNEQRPKIACADSEPVKYCIEQLSQNLAFLMAENKISLIQLHRNTNVPLTTLKRIRNDKDANPTISSLLPIAEFFSITLNQLLGLKPLPDTRAKGVYQENRSFWAAIPVISWQDAQHWPANQADTLSTTTILTDVEVSNQAFALIVQDEDWALFPKGTKLIFDPCKQPKAKNYILVTNVMQDTLAFYQLLTYDGVQYLKPPCLELQAVVYEMDNYVFKGTLAQARMDQE